MNKKIIISLNIIFILILAQHCIAGSWFEKSEYAARRVKFMEQIPDGVAVILGATTPVSDRQFFQSSDFFYFTGVEIPNAVLIMDGMSKVSTLFFSISERDAQGEGISLELVRKPAEVTGIERISPIERLSSTLSRLSLQTNVFYTMFRSEELSRENTNEKFRALQRTMTMNMWDGRLTRELQFVKRLKEKFPHITVKD
ncbi:MAG: aminopeptidase P N-terminal domain-containing protein, partial [Candidatus Aminicenantes bacterium]|nr:aminopeptidase P N-terminal domain-containing protein [Candidatus Aminicenantes bacterium]